MGTKKGKWNEGFEGFWGFGDLEGREGEEGTEGKEGVGTLNIVIERKIVSRDKNGRRIFLFTPLVYNLIAMRVFIGIELPKDLKEKIYFFSQEISRKYQIKLVEKENLHLTLIFLGNIEEGAVREIGEIGGIGEIRLRLGKPEFFPRKRPRGIWINVEGEIEKLKCLHKKIIDLLLARGFPLEESCLRFSPHITIGRIRGRVGELRGLGDLRSARWRMGDGFWVKKVTFFESKLSNKGPKYSKISELEVK